MSSKRYTDEFKIEAVRQVTDRESKVAANCAGGRGRLRGAWQQGHRLKVRYEEVRLVFLVTVTPRRLTGASGGGPPGPS